MSDRLKLTICNLNLYNRNIFKYELKNFYLIDGNNFIIFDN